MYMETWQLCVSTGLKKRVPPQSWRAGLQIKLYLRASPIHVSMDFLGRGEEIWLWLCGQCLGFLQDPPLNAWESHLCHKVPFSSSMNLRWWQCLPNLGSMRNHLNEIVPVKLLAHYLACNWLSRKYYKAVEVERRGWVCKTLWWKCWQQLVWRVSEQKACGW